MTSPRRKRHSSCIIPRQYGCRIRASHPAASRWFAPTGAAQVPSFIRAQLNALTVPHSTSTAIERTIERAVDELASLPGTTGTGVSRAFGCASETFAGVLREFAHLRMGFWVASTLVLITGVWSTTSHLLPPLALASGCAPVLLLLSLPSVLHARDAGTLELELTCHRSAIQALVDRLVAAVLCASVTQTIISAALALVGDVSFARSMLLWVGASALMLTGAVASVQRFRSGPITLTGSAVWIVLITYADEQPRLAADVYRVNMLAWIACDAVALALSVWIVRQTLTQQGVEQLAIDA
jgi:hypothetical protein